MLTIEVVELFHLIFLEQFGRKVAKDLYVLKGGCNLRFFLKSIRYSQDIDLDIRVVRKDTLRKTVNQILSSTPFRLIMQSHQMEILTISEPKQTETTQRWKVSLNSNHVELPIHTKIEFSRRGVHGEVAVDTIDEMILQKYQLRSFLIPHYIPEAAYLQKVSALISRTETQGRDVFDLYHLMTMGVCPSLPPLLKKEVQSATSNAMGISFKEYRSQVVSYLSVEHQKIYGEEHVWEKMCLRVVEGLEHAAS